MYLICIASTSLRKYVPVVYPTLGEKLQKEWDEAEQARYDGLITDQVVHIKQNTDTITQICLFFRFNSISVCLSRVTVSCCGTCSRRRVS